MNDIVVCPRCGCHVIDWMTHEEWHSLFTAAASGSSRTKCIACGSTALRVTDHSSVCVSCGRVQV